MLAQNDSPKGKPLRVEVLAQQYAWQFTYPEEGGIKATNLYLPIDRSTKLELRARDVLHSFWVPEFGQKQDAVPGIVTTVVITPTKTGEYRLICTELCGLGHALMRTRAIVLSQADFVAWTKKQPQGGGSAGGAGGGEIDAKGDLHRELRGLPHAHEGGHERDGRPEPRRPLPRAGGGPAADPQRRRRDAAVRGAALG